MRILAARLLCLAIGLFALSCGGGSDSQGIAITFNTASQPATNNPVVTSPANIPPQANQPPANTQQTGTEILDVAFSGAMQGAWRTGDRSTGVICTIFGNNQLNVAMFGMLNNANFGLAVHQDNFTQGPYVFPLAASPSAPWVQVTSPSDANLQWDANGPKGRGSLTIAGNATSQVGGSIDADLVDKAGGPAIHVRGSFTCRVGGR